MRMCIIVCACLVLFRIILGISMTIRSGLPTERHLFRKEKNSCRRLNKLSVQVISVDSLNLLLIGICVTLEFETHLFNADLFHFLEYLIFLSLGPPSFDPLLWFGCCLDCCCCVCCCDCCCCCWSCGVG